MRLIKRVAWKDDVFPSWQRASSSLRPNSDVWKYLPPGVEWFQSTIESYDIPRVFVLGSSDFFDTFGSYRLEPIAENIHGDDNHEAKHKERMRNLAVLIEQGVSFERPILVADSIVGPFTIIDGNHRMAAYQSLGRLAGLEVFFGVSRLIRSSFDWAKPAYSIG